MSLRQRPARAPWIVALAVTACATQAAPTADCPPSTFRSSPPLVIAHAGGEGLGPENTLIAMQRSLAAGADILDVDLRMSSDGIVVARHDRELATSTDGSGPIDSRTFAELAQLDAAAHWTGTPIDEPVRVPALAEILTTFPDVIVSLEIKQSEPSIATSLCDVLTAADALDRVYVSANDDDDLYDAERVCPGMLITTTYADLADRRAAEERGDPWCAASPIGQPPYEPGRFDADSVARSHEHGQAIFTWTVDDPSALRELAAAGVDGVYTRRPDVARAVFDNTAASD